MQPDEDARSIEGTCRELDAAEVVSAERLFRELLDLPPAARDAALRARDSLAPRVVAEVRALLAFSQAGSSGPLDRAEQGGLIGVSSASLLEAMEQQGAGGSKLAAHQPNDSPGFAAHGVALAVDAIVGRYRIVRTLGAGSMGIVYLAEQERPRRAVALKIIRPGLARGRAAGSILRRFEHEAELLGRLQHPGIAQIIEAGAVDSGQGEQPYFAMEHVEGRELRAHAEHARLGVRERLELVLKICDAIEHAHRRGVIHRDLKPDNIIVDASGQPKILDFGIARATRAAGADVTQLTHAQQLLGTLAYMSPEQAGGDPDAVDTRSDVYAVGAILFELLSGAQPHELAGASIVDAIRIVREREPRRLAALRPELRGDLDVICARALATERGQRYQSAAELGADLRRHLGDEPIAARPPSTIYQLVKFARRRRGLVTGIAIAALAMVVGLAVSVAAWQRARSEAERQAAVAGFLREMLQEVAPAAAMGADTTLLKQVLDRTAQRIDAEGEIAPEVRVELLGVIGNVYADLSDFPRAESALRSALAIEEASGDVDGARAASIMGRLGSVRCELGQYAEAAELTERAAALRVTLFGGNSPEYASSLEELAVLRAIERRFDDAERLLRQALAIREADDGESEEVAATLRTLGLVLSRAGRPTEAVACSEHALAMVQALRSGDHPSIATSLTSLGVRVAESHDISRAEEILTRAMEMNRRMLGVGHAQTISSMIAVATILRMRGLEAEGAVLVNESIDAIRRRFGPDSTQLALALSAAAEHRKDVGGALATYEEALAVMRRATSDRPESSAALKSLVELEASLDGQRESSLLRAIEIGRELERDFLLLGPRADPDRTLMHIVIFSASLAERAWGRLALDPQESTMLVAEAERALTRAEAATNEGSVGWRRPLEGARAATEIVRVAAAAAAGPPELDRSEGDRAADATQLAEAKSWMIRGLDQASEQLDLAADTGGSRVLERNSVTYFGSKSVARWRERLDETRRRLQVTAPAE